MKRILLMSSVFLTVLFGQLFAQDRVVTGKVTSQEDGSTLPGVNVTIKGTTQGTTSGPDGTYRISVGSNPTLVFSFIGLVAQEVEVGNRTTVDVAMSADVKQLTEVVVTAQGIERTKNELPYAAQKVEGELVSRSRDNNFANALSGKVSGVQIQRNNSIGGSTNVIVRGFKSLNGTNQALFIVDGVPIDNAVSNTTDQNAGRGGYDFGNAAADINPDDIESINVLKGAAATALYGSRASNGVVLITTKKGSKKGLGVTINAGVTLGYADKSTLPKYQKQYGGGYGQYYGPNEDAYFNEADVNGDGEPDLIVPTYEDASYGAAFDPNLSVYQWNAFGDPTSPKYGQATPWVAGANDPTKFFETAVSTNNSVMLDGGSERGYFKLGYTRNEDKGIMPNSKVLKDFLNFGASFNVTKKLTASASINFTNVSGKGRYGTGYDGDNGRNVMTSFRQWWQTNVDVEELKDAYFRNNENITWNWSSGLPETAGLIYWDNPYWVRYQNYENDNRARYFGNVRLDYKFNDWLSVMGRVSLDSYNELQEERVALGSVGVANYTRRNRSFQEKNYDLMFNFNKKLGEDFNLRAVLGTNIRRTTFQSISASTNGGLLIPNFYALSNTANPLTPPVESFSDLQVNGYYVNTTLGFRDFIFLDLAARRDEASSLPKGNNVYYYPSVSTSFVFSELIKNAPWLTLGKIRLNYAEVGNTAPTSSINDFYSQPTAFGTIPLFSIPNTKNNPDLKPERTRSYEAGVEMAFFQGRLGFDATYYRTSSVDQILPVSVSTATGYSFKYVNAGEIENKGIELSAFVTPVKTSSFSWTINANWTRNRNKVLSLYEGVDNLLLQSYQTGITVNASIGEPYGTLRGTDYIYVNGEKSVGSNGRYLKTTETNKVIGNINPDWIGGISNTLTYKSLALSFLIDMKKGGDVYSVDMNYGLSTGLYEETAGLNDLGNPVRNAVSDGGGIIWPGVKQDGTPNDIRSGVGAYPGFGGSRLPLAGFIYDASYVKLREVSLTYSLPQALIAKLSPFRGIDFSVIGRNLWIIHKNVPYADPEDNLSAGNAQGVQIGALPNTRTVGFNVRLKF